MSKRLVISTSVELYNVNPVDIAYICASGNYSDMVMVNRSQYTFSFNLQHFGQLMVDQLQSDAKRFIRIGKSLIVNREYIFRINPARQQIELITDGMREKFVLTASKEALKQVKSLFESNQS